MSDRDLHAEGQERGLDGPDLEAWMERQAEGDPGEDAQQDKVLIQTAERITHEILGLARMLSPEAWQRVHALLVPQSSGWHTRDVGVMAEVRLIAMHGAVRFKPDRAYIGGDQDG